MLIRHRRLRSLLRYIHPEVTYTLSHLAFRNMPSLIIKLLREDLVLETKLFNLKLRNPVGVGAGIDKNGDLARVFIELGCGFHVVGSVVLGEKRGNPHPRLYRYPERLALINALGLPSKGASYVLRQLERISRRRESAHIVANIAGESLQELVALSRIFDRADSVDIIEINLSCPQYTRSDFHRPDIVEELLLKVRSICTKPVLVKISPRIDTSTLRGIVRVCERFTNVGLTISNSFPTTAGFLSSGVGGVSGLPLYRLSKKLISYVRALSDVTVVACGGVFTGRQVLELITKYNVSAVQIVTALAYGGLHAVSNILKELKHIVRGHGDQRC